jgi:DNA-binding winged helix-turn-helix (wHTH) protein/Tol biopolymer transport system component
VGEAVRTTRFIKFEAFEVDLQEREVRKKGVKLRLTGQPFQVLAVLLERPGEVVTREELRQRLWAADTFVDFDHGLNAAVNRLREVLGDSPEKPRFVETLPRRGYRFIGSLQEGADFVQPVPASTDSTTTESPADRTPVKTPAWWRFRKKPLVVLLLLLSCFAILSALYRWRQPRHTSRPALEERQLTSNSADNHVLSAAISPDGKYLAYLDMTGLLVRTIGSGDVHQVSVKEDFRRRIADVVWSPTGGELLATLEGLNKDEAPSIWTIPLVGQGEPRKRLEPAALPSISPDGEMMAFVTELGRSAGEIWLAKINGEAAQKWLGNDEGWGLSSPAWSPDGGWIAYEKTNLDSFVISIEMRPVSGGTARTILPNPRLPQLALVPWAHHPLSFSPDWRLLFMAMQRRDFLSSTVSLWRIAVNSSRPDAEQPEKIVAWPDLDFVGFSISAHGERLALLKRQYQSGIYVGRLEKDYISLDAVHRLTADTRTSFPTGWTRDSQQLLFASVQTGTPKIFKQQIDNSVAERVTSGSGSELGPKMSPDDTSILYAEYSGPENDPHSTKLMSISAAGAQPRVLLETKGAFEFQCPHVAGPPCVISQKEGDKVLFYSLDPAGGRGRQIATRKKEDALGWALSPDGLRLAALGLNNRITMFNMKVAGPAWQQVNLKGSVEAALDQIGWTADGSGFFLVARFRSFSSPQGALLNIGLDGQVKVVWKAPLDRILTFPVASPNGKYVAFGVIVWDGNVWLLENF